MHTHVHNPVTKSSLPELPGTSASGTTKTLDLELLPSGVTFAPSATFMNLNLGLALFFIAATTRCKRLRFAPALDHLHFFAQTDAKNPEPVDLSSP
jgi:hypothetical protein